MRLLANIEEIRPHRSGKFLVRYRLLGQPRAALIAPTAPGAADILGGRWAHLTLERGEIVRAEPASVRRARLN